MKPTTNARFQRWLYRRLSELLLRSLHLKLQFGDVLSPLHYNRSTEHAYPPDFILTNELSVVQHALMYERDGRGPGQYLAAHWWAKWTEEGRP